MKRKTKENGVVYTPDYIVQLILEQSGYNNEKILNKHAIDNSCGDGRFLVEIVEMYIKYFLTTQEKEIVDMSRLKFELETYIHGIELDQEEVFKCIRNLDNVAFKYGLIDVNWDIKQGNSLEATEYNGKMDFVLGNPPYVRVHNLKENFEHIKKQKFTNVGMTDLFIIFYEIGLEMLNKDGVLGYITPSSIFNSLAGLEFRKFVINNKLLTSVIDLKHFQAFEKFTTYTAILILDNKNDRSMIDFYNFDGVNKEKVFIEQLNYDDFLINENWYFGSKSDLLSLKSILNTDTKNKEIEVKNGFATLADSIFIQEKFDFSSKFIFPVLKGSTKKWSEIIYPYNEEGSIVDFEVFEEKLKEYFNKNMQVLEKRSLDKHAKWYAFGRSQGIKDFWKEKISVNSLLRTENDIKLQKLDPGIGVYSGLYIIGNVDFEVIEKLLVSHDFVNYISLLGKYKSGGYYTFSSSDLKKFILFKLRNGGNLR